MTLTPTTWRNVYSPADSPSWTSSVGGAHAYEVYDIWGPVKTGTASGTTVTIPPPSGGWPYGHYRVYVPSLGEATTFTVIDQTDGRFPTKPATLTPYVATGFGGTYGDVGGYDPALHGVFGLGPNRLAVGDAASSEAGYAAGPVNLANTASYEQDWYHNPAYADPAHPREQFAAFAETYPSPTVDYAMLYDAGGTNYGNESLIVYCASSSANGSSIFVAVDPGTSSGFKVTVRAPNSTTVVETYDNLASPAAAQTTINAASTRIRAFNQARGGNPTTRAATAIGNAARTRVASVSASFAAEGVTWFEGPWNEPQNATAGQVAHEYGIWSVSVKQGAPAAKTMGPGPVSYNRHYQTWMDSFFTLVDRTNLDGVSVHAYNTHNGDVRLTRQCLVDLRAMLTAQGLNSKPLWQTEQGWQWPWYGVERPRTAVSYYMLLLLMQEQYGLPIERNYYWYDVENSFWLMPMVKTRGQLHPLAAAYRTLTAERFGKTLTSSLDFGEPGNDLYIGNVYTAAGGAKTIALLNCGEGDGGAVTFTVTGATSLTRLDCYGNATTVTVTGGQAVVAVDNVPTYLRVPAGVTATVTPLAYGTDLAQGAAVTSSGGSRAPAARITTPGTWSSYYNDTSYFDPEVGTPNSHSPWQSASATMPQTVTVTLPTAQTANVAVIRSATLWQELTTLLDFDVQTSPDGSAWTTVHTYTKDPTGSYAVRDNGNPASPSGAEMWDDERFVWRVPFTDRTVKAIRIVIRECTPGGVLDDTTATIMAGNNTAGVGTTYPTLTSVRLYDTAVTVEEPPVEEPPPAPLTPGNKYVVRTIA